MNASQIHLALNHAPLFFSIMGGLILLFGMFRKNESIKTFSLYFLIAAALFIIPVYLTGEGTEEIVEKIPGVSESLIEKHESMAKIGLVIILITGLIAMMGLLIKKRFSFAKHVLMLCAVLSLASFAVMAQTAHLGGQIRHSEIRNGMTSGGENETENEDSGKKDRVIQKDEKDDD